MRYPIPALDAGDIHIADIEIERSRFIAWVCHAPRITAFEALLTLARQTYPDASHHCSAFIAGPPGEQTAIGFSDDGEPGGTAGRPMYQVLDGAGIGQVGCVVTRYFGGIKLGTGGLARAYSQAVQKALESLPQRDFTERRTRYLQIGFAGEAEARAWLGERDIPVEAVDYDAQGVTLSVGWPLGDTSDLSVLQSRLKGQLSVLE